MLTLAIINDYVVDRRMKLFFDQDDYDMLEEQWDVKDEILVDLQSTSLFAGRMTWAALDPMHYRLLIATTMSKTFAFIDEEKEAEANAAVESLTFLVSALIRCIEDRGDCHVEMIRLVRVGDLDLVVEYQASLSMEEDLPKARVHAKPAKGIQVVVDNS
jgi:hypothetical protein